MERGEVGVEGWCDGVAIRWATFSRRSGSEAQCAPDASLDSHTRDCLEGSNVRRSDYHPVDLALLVFLFILGKSGGQRRQEERIDG